MLIESLALVVFVFSTWFTFFALRRLVRRPRTSSPRWRAAMAARMVQSPDAATPLDLDLWRSGAYEPTARRDFRAARAMLVAFCLCATGVVLISTDRQQPEQWAQIFFIGGVVTLLAYSLPRLHLAWLAHRRVRRIEAGLPAAVDLISMCLAGGLSLEDSLSRAADELDFAHRDVALELTIVRRQAQVASLTQALKHFARRIDAPSVASLVSIVSQSERLGTNIATALHEYADGLRQRYRQQVEERANKTGIRMLFPLVFCLAPSVFVLIWGPALLQVREFVMTEMGPDGLLSQDIPTELLQPPTLDPIQ